MNDLKGKIIFENGYEEEMMTFDDKYFSLIYWDRMKFGFVPIEITLEEWQYQAIVQLLGLSITQTEQGFIANSFTKEFVYQRLEKMGILVSPEQYQKMKNREKTIKTSSKTAEKKGKDKK